MNTDFAGPQLHGVIEREQPQAIIYDSEFSELLDGAEEVAPRIARFVSWVDEGHESSVPNTEDAIAAHLRRAARPARRSRAASSSSPRARPGRRRAPSAPRRARSAPLAVLLSKIPLRSEGTTMLAAPMFHSWGFMHFTLGLALGSTYVLHRRFKPEAVLRAIEEHQADALVVVPVMLQRIMELDEETRSKYDLASLRVTAVSGSALPGELAIRWMDDFGDNVYNLYGSTEVAWASIATPEDMRRAPGTAGRIPHGTIVKLYDEVGKEVPRGETGRIFVGNEMSFEGYTGGGGKDVIDGLLSSGDVGHFDENGCLFIDGRDDEMIVSGGENVFPREVEDVLADSRGDRRGRRHRRRRREVRPAPQGLRRDQLRQGPRRGRRQGPRQGQPGPLQGAARGRVPRRAPPQPDRQGPQARARRAGWRGRGRYLTLTVSEAARLQTWRCFLFFFSTVFAASA